MSLRFAVLLALAGVTAVTAGCVVEPAAPPRPVVYAEPLPPGSMVKVVAPRAPPITVVEQIPPPRRGYIWSRGYWQWDGTRYVAVRGHWEAMHPGYHYVHPHWVHGRDGWHFRPGIWVAG